MCRNMLRKVLYPLGVEHYRFGQTAFTRTAIRSSSRSLRSE